MGSVGLRDLHDLSGRVALVTGGSRGLGQSMVRALAEARADVVITSRKGGCV
jgi:NAD(P)-dependent dehydrogenase (short-subunit alcohol dehydrogenase family)